MKRSLRILVADDEPVMQTYLADTLGSLGHEVVGVAENGQALIDLCRELKPDLVVTDVCMPGVNGLHAVQAVAREYPVPAVVITGHDGVETAIAAVCGCGPAVYLVKPIESPDLELAIGAALERFEQLQMLLDQEPNAEKALADWQWIVEAKALLMNWLKVGDAVAFDRLRQVADERNLTLVDAAKRIIATAGASASSQR